MPIVNSWTEWGQLEEVCVGRADNACFPPIEPNLMNLSIHHEEIGKYFTWPEGRKKKEVIDRANRELDAFVDILEGEGITVRRPASVDHYIETKTPSWSSKTQSGTACPRDVFITLGNIVLEANMSDRARFFEHLPYRNIIRDLWQRDEHMKWKAMPKASLDDDCYDITFWTKDRVKGDDCTTLTEKEPILEAAVCCSRLILFEPNHFLF